MKEKAYYLHYKDNTNSWRRMMMLFNLYWPGFKHGFIFYSLYPFLAYIFAILAKIYMHISLNWIIEYPITVLIYLSPLMLTKRDYRDICAQLPVTRTEKLGFILLTFCIAFPLTIELSLYLSKLLCNCVFHAQIPIDILFMKMIGKDLGLKIPELLGIVIQTASFITVTLYFIVKEQRTNGGGLNVGFSGTIILLLVFLLSYGTIVSLISYFRDDLSGIHKSFKLLLTIIGFLVYQLIGVIYLVKLFRYLRNHGF